MPPRRRKRSAGTQASPLEALMAQLWTAWMDDADLFMFGDGTVPGAVVTMDEHDADSPLKPLPDRPHLRELNALWDESHQLVIGKSRQMMVSWWGMARILHEIMHPGRRWAVTCKRFDDADALLERMWGMYQRLPPNKPKAERKQGLIRVTHPGGATSEVQALSQDSEAARSKTFSGIWIDEAAFTDNLEALYRAAKPTTMAGGKLVMVSSPNGRGLFYALLTDSGRLEL